MDPPRGGRKRGHSRGNGNPRGGQPGRHQHPDGRPGQPGRHHHPDGRTYYNFPNVANEMPDGYVDDRSGRNPVEHGRERRQLPPSTNHPHTRSSVNNTACRSNQQSHLLENVEVTGRSGNNPRKAKDKRAQSTTPLEELKIPNSRKSREGDHQRQQVKPDFNVWGAEGYGTVQHRGLPILTRSQNMSRQKEVLFAVGNNSGKPRFSDNSWVMIPSADSNSYEDDNISVCSTDSYMAYNNSQNSDYCFSNVLSGPHSNHLQKVPSYDFPKLGIYWDIENCPVPRQKSALHLVKRIRDTFCANTHTEEEFIVACDTSNQKKELLDQLSVAQVDVQHISASSKNASDDMLRRKMNDFADHNNPPAKVVLITGDINFASDIFKLKSKRHFQVVLLHNQQTSEALRMHASKCISYEEFCEDLPILQNAEVVTERIPATLEVSNLPQDIAENQIRFELKKMFSPFGGKTISMSNPTHTALIKFAAISDARKAQSRLEGHDMHGTRIRVKFVDNNSKNITANSAEIKNKTQKEGNTNPKSSTGIALPEDTPPEEKELLKGNKSVVRFVVNGTIGIKELTPTLKSIMPIEDLCVLSNDNDQTCCIVELPSLKKAKKTVKVLTSLKPLNVTNAEIVKGNASSDITAISSQTADKPSKESEMKNWRNKWNKIKQAYSDRHEAHTKELNTRLWELRRQMSSMEPYNKDPMIEIHEKAIVSQLSLLSNVQKEFDTRTEQLVKKFLRRKDIDMSVVSSFLLAECHRFMRATPVHAVYSSIAAKVLGSSITIVSGPPGTSKSTEVIQCILSTELFPAETTIVCTQPHKVLVSDRNALVASQMQSTVGKKVVSVGTRKNDTNNQSAKLLYLSDAHLLEEVFADAQLANYGCIILDEIQERSLATELLLVYLESLVQLRPDLKVVILSTPDHASILYQHVGHIENIALSMEPYPVEIIWHSNPLQNHVDACMKVAMQLHLSQEVGDILIFLACVSEVGYAESLLLKEAAKRTDICIIKLVLSIEFKEMRKKLSQQGQARNIILTCSELANIITIPSVRYVVDSGLLSESSWGQCTEIIEVKYINDSMAAIRANKAGVKMAGQCYRMYSPDQCNSLQTRGPQEKELGLMVLKLYQMGINPREYNYLESPDQLQLESVIKQLQDIGAINNDELTNEGKKMAFLPLEPHLSFLLFEAHKQKEGFAALILCAIVSVATSFTLPQNDKVASKFPTGNLLLLVELFQMWFSMKAPERKKLITGKRIDSLIMNVIQDKVMELHEILKKVGIRIKLSLDTNQWKRVLTVLLLQHWKDNLCVLHNPQSRTYHWQKSNQYVVLLPACCECKKPLAERIVFQKLWKTPWGDFISIVFPIDEDIIQESVEHDIPYNLGPNDIAFRFGGPFLIQSMIMGFSGEKLALWEKQLNELAGFPVTIKALPSSGTVIVTAPETSHSQIIQKLENELESGRELMLNERWEYNLVNYPGMRIQWHQYAEVTQVLMPDDFTSIFVTATKSTPTNKVLATFQKYGRIVQKTETVTRTKKKQVMIMYEKPETARIAANCTEFSARPVGKKMEQFKFELKFVHFNATWIRRKNLGTAIVYFKSDADIAEACVCLATKKADCFGESVMMPEPDNKRIVIKQLPTHVSLAELKESITYCLAKQGEDTLIRISMGQEKAVESTSNDVACAKQQLQLLFSQYSHKMFAAIHQPNIKDDVWTATVGFEDENAGHVVIQDLSKNAVINSSPVHFNISYQCSTKCNSSVFDQINYKFAPLVTKRQSESGDKKATVRTTTESALNSCQTVVCINGPDASEVKRLYQDLVRLLQNAIIIDEFPCDANYLFCEGGPGRRFLDSLRQKHKTWCALIALKKKQIVLYGKDASKVKREIDEFIKVESIKMSSLAPQSVDCSSSPSLIRQLILAAAMDAKSKLSPKKAEDLKQTNSFTEICPVCSELTSNADFQYRMEYCGHAYCEPCMVAYLETAVPPLQCLSLNCDAPLVCRDLAGLHVLQTLRYPGLMERLAERATTIYVESNTALLCYCPLPGCEGILRIKSEPQLCARCQNAVCSRCNVLYHFGDTCDEFQRNQIPDTARPTTKSVKKKSTSSPTAQNVTSD